MIEFVRDNYNEILHQTAEHLWLSGISILLSGTAGILVGVALTRRQKLAAPVIGLAGVLQTIPSLAMLGLFIPLLGIGKPPAIVALFLYGLLPIIRNTYTGITNVNLHVKEAALAMGMTDLQLLRKIELPLALPVIFAGVRTATVINVGVATLCALIGAGGLGEFIFRGITLNHMPMIMAGAVPASLLAIALDYSLAFVEKDVRKRAKHFITVVMVAIAIPAVIHFTNDQSSGEKALVAGFNAEFMNREDGWPGLQEAYGLELATVELEITLMYEALKNNEVDVIAGFTTDGRIDTYDLKVLEDDRGYFPPYYAVPIVNQSSLEQFPLIKAPLLALEGKISEKLIAGLNLMVDSQLLTIAEAADSLLSYFKIPARHTTTRNGKKLVVGSKAFTENYILATFLSRYLEKTTPYSTDLKLGFGGTKLLFDALREGSIAVYPEYTGTAWLVFAKPSPQQIETLKYAPDRIFHEANKVLTTQFGVVMFPSIGFNNTTALMMKNDKAKSLNINTITDLKNYLTSLED